MDANILNIEDQIKYEYSDGRDRVFISYQHESFPFVRKLSDYLEKRGTKVWYAPRNIRLEGLWPEKLHEAIENCKAVLLLYTEQADKSKHVIREVAIADDYNKPVLWLKLDASEPNSKVLKYYLSLVQTIEYSGDDAILESLNEILKEDTINLDSINTKYGIIKDSTRNLVFDNWTRGVFAFDNADDAAECAARVYFRVCNLYPKSTALLPTGRSARHLFQAMVRIAATEYESNPFGDAYLMNDTETFGVRSTHPTSRIKAINDNLIDVLKAMNCAPPDNHLIYLSNDTNDMDPEDLCSLLLEKYPPSISGVSISPFMEILGYDLGLHDEKIINDGPRVINVLEETRSYIDDRQKSSSIYTVGLKTVLQSKYLILFAFDVNKSSAIERLFKEKKDPKIPISLLRDHQNAFVIVTKEVAKKAGIDSFATMNMSPKEAAECITKTLY